MNSIKVIFPRNDFDELFAQRMHHCPPSFQAIVCILCKFLADPVWGWLDPLRAGSKQHLLARVEKYRKRLLKATFTSLLIKHEVGDKDYELAVSEQSLYVKEHMEYIGAATMTLVLMELPVYRPREHEEHESSYEIFGGTCYSVNIDGSWKRWIGAWKRIEGERVALNHISCAFEGDHYYRFPTWLTQVCMVHKAAHNMLVAYRNVMEAIKLK